MHAWSNLLCMQHTAQHISMESDMERNDRQGGQSCEPCGYETGAEISRLHVVTREVAESDGVVSVVVDIQLSSLHLASVCVDVTKVELWEVFQFQAAVSGLTILRRSPSVTRRTSALCSIPLY